MTSRVTLATVAVATLVLMLMLSGVVAGRAAVQNCSVFPERCQYGGNGVNYFYPQGYRMPSSTAGSGGAWGCAATDGKAKGWSGGFPNRASALYGALSACAKHGGQCRIITCSSSIHSAAEARATLFGTTHR